MDEISTLEAIGMAIIVFGLLAAVVKLLGWVA